MAKNLRFVAFACYYCLCNKWGFRIRRLRIILRTTWSSWSAYIEHSDGAHNTNLRNSHNTLLLFDESKNTATTASTVDTNLLKNRFLVKGDYPRQRLLWFFFYRKSEIDYFDIAFSLIQSFSITFQPFLRGIPPRNALFEKLDSLTP